VKVECMYKTIDNKIWF